MVNKCIKQNNLMQITFILFVVIGIYLLIKLTLNEGFQTENLKNDFLNKIKIGLSEKLGISFRRLLNVVYTGNIKDNNLKVTFQVDKRNNMERLEKSTHEIKKNIEDMMNDGLFIIRIGNEYVNIASREDFNVTSNNSNYNSNSKNIDNSNGNNNNNIQQSEQFQDQTYLRNYDPRFDNIDIFNAAKFVMSKYKNIPYDPELSQFITLDTQDGKLVAISDLNEEL
jgi:hypothetical protein